jgi:hypothetical protein
MNYTRVMIVITKNLIKFNKNIFIENNENIKNKFFKYILV